jgi:hypothetical protein
MERTLNRDIGKKCRRFTLSTTSKVDPAGVFSTTENTEVVIWADCAFVYSIGDAPSVTLPTEATSGDVVWPANVPARIGIPAGQRIAAAAVTGTGNIVIMPGV